MRLHECCCRLPRSGAVPNRILRENPQHLSLLAEGATRELTLHLCKSDLRGARIPRPELSAGPHEQRDFLPQFVIGLVRASGESASDVYSFLRRL